MPRKKRQTLPAKFEPGFLRDFDRRTEIYQRLAATYDEIVTDAGGEHEIPHTKLALIDRFVFLEATLQTWEREIATNPKAAEHLVSRWIQGVNSLQGLAKVIGLKRRPKTVDLKAYVEGRA